MLYFNFKKISLNDDPAKNKNDIPDNIIELTRNMKKDALAWAWNLGILNKNNKWTHDYIKAIHSYVVYYTYDDGIHDYFPNPLAEIGGWSEPPEPGVYRDCNLYLFYNSVPGKKVLVNMEKYINWLNQKEKAKAIDPELFCAEAYIRLGRIHPFPDGNGRTIRMFLNLILVRNDRPALKIDKFVSGRDYQLSREDINRFAEHIMNQYRFEKGEKTELKNIMLDSFTNLVKEIKKPKNIKIDCAGVEDSVISARTISKLKYYSQIIVEFIAKYCLAHIEQPIIKIFLRKDADSGQFDLIIRHNGTVLPKKINTDGVIERYVNAVKYWVEKNNGEFVLQKRAGKYLETRIRYNDE